jgi:adenylate cyclase
MGEKFVRFSISAKLILIITFLVLVSLGAMTFLDYFLERGYVEADALRNNLDINRRLSAEVEYTLAGAPSGVISKEALDGISFPPGPNETFFLNGNGDVLIHPDKNLARVGANFSNLGFFQAINASPVWSGQQIYEDDGKKYLIAYNKINKGPSVVITRIEYDKIFERVNAGMRRDIFFIAAILCLCIPCIRFYSKKITVPLGALSDAAKKIEKGDFKIDIKQRSGDEIGVLAGDFINMGEALEVFGKFTNRDIAIKAMNGEIKDGGVQKTATVLISDIHDFSEKTKGFTPDMLVGRLNEFFALTADCVEKAGGLVDKFIGDSVMAHWGTVYSEGTAAKDAFNAIKAALMLRKALITLNKDNNPPFTAGCGITTGQVTAGKFGPDNRAEYTVIGEPVGVAREIEGLNKKYGTDILISEETNKLVNYFYITEEMPPVTVRGKDKPARIFAVVNHVSVTSGPKTLAEVRKLLGIKV